MDVIANCPVQGYARAATRKGADFARAMRSLRLSLRRCRQCEAEHECPIRGQFSEALHAAIQSVQAELHLAGGGGPAYAGVPAGAGGEDVGS